MIPYHLHDRTSLDRESCTGFGGKMEDGKCIMYSHHAAWGGLAVKDAGNRETGNVARWPCRA